VSASWTLCGSGGALYQSDRPGTLGGHRRSKLYGRLDCRSALQALARGGYARDRVFFLDEHTAQASGYRPCAVCLPDRYAAWKTGGPLPGSRDDLQDRP
jgi:Metal binding domain of Ada